ncbi:Hypothetical predicted protein [Pelobates cultripes]|uniref:Uncharacterized protein n=1 Tax=Pelobates cultripes TaxID=61616 RepID=A0AAD1VM08_PELCU|nr:Hypothetical predicted protein [Pelobates cultripes]
MADTTCAYNPSDTSQDVLTRINNHFEAFWRKLVGEHHSPTPIKRTGSRQTPSLTQAGRQCKPAFPPHHRSGKDRHRAPHSRKRHIMQRHLQTRRGTSGPRPAHGLCYSTADRARKCGEPRSMRHTGKQKASQMGLISPQKGVTLDREWRQRDTGPNMAATPGQPNNVPQPQHGAPPEHKLRPRPRLTKAPEWDCGIPLAGVG